MRTILLLAISVLSLHAVGQTQQKHLIEYFTNTLCSICANRNPGFHSNIENSENTILISYHPSSPYSACVINKFNTSGNDARTQFYNIYGGTPRLVVGGNVKSPSENYSSPQIFPEPNTTDLEIKAFSTPEVSNDGSEISASVSIYSNSSQSGLKLFLYVVEDTVFYNAPNGENLHYNVFRTSMNGIEGVDLETFSDSTFMSAALTGIELPGVDLDRLHLVAFLMNSESEVVQAEQFEIQKSEQASNIEEKESVSLQKISGTNMFQFSDNIERNYSVRNINGQVLFSGRHVQINLNKYPSGLYIIEAENKVFKAIR